jgi:propionate CoA-transferase
MALSLRLESKIRTAEEAVQLIRSGDCFTVSGTVTAMLPEKLLQALEMRFLSDGEPRDLTWFDPFPTGVPGIEPLSHPGLLKRVIGGWYTPHPRLREMIVGNEVEAYLYPLGTLSFWCQAMAAGRDVYLTKVGLETYLDPRNGGGRLNERTAEELVKRVTIAGEEWLAYQQLPITVALIRGTVVDEAGNLSIEDEAITMNVLYQALAAKRFGGKVIVQARSVVPEGQIPARLVAVPGVLVDAAVLDADAPVNWLPTWARLERPPGQVSAAANPDAWKRWVCERVLDEELAPPMRTLTPDVLVGRRAVLEMRAGNVVNIGQGLPARDILPVTLEEGIEEQCLFSIETGTLGGFANGAGFRANTTSVLDTPGIFSLYGSGLIGAAFFSMLEFDREGNVNLLRHGDTWVGPGGSMDIAEAARKIVFCGTFRAGGLDAEGRNGRLEVRREGDVPRGVERVQGVCFNGRRMHRQGKDVLYVTERAVFRLTGQGPELIEVAPGVDVERQVLGQMDFRPAIAADLRQVDPRVYTPGVMGVAEDWEKGRG